MSKKKVLEVLGTSLNVMYKAAVVVHEVDMAVNHSLACGCYRRCYCYRRRPVLQPVVVVERPYNVFDDIFAPRRSTLLDSMIEDDRRRDRERAREREHEREMERIRERNRVQRDVVAEARVEARDEARAEVRRTERKVEDLEAEVARLRRELLGK